MLRLWTSEVRVLHGPQHLLSDGVMVTTRGFGPRVLGSSPSRTSTHQPRSYNYNEDGNSPYVGTEQGSYL